MEDVYKKLRTNSYSVPCELCSIGSMCVPLLKNNSLGMVLNRKRGFVKDEIIIKAGDPLTKFYVIHSGSLKTYVETKDGHQQITGFYLPGDILGFEGISQKMHYNHIQALANILVCELKYDELMSLVSRDIHVRNMVITLMSTEILNQQKLLLMLSQKNAEERLATFIYSLYCRYSNRGHVSLNIKLTMSRSDIANYLGLTIETVSRVFTRLQQLDVLIVKGKHILIKNLPELVKISGESR